MQTISKHVAVTSAAILLAFSVTTVPAFADAVAPDAPPAAQVTDDALEQSPLPPAEDDSSDAVPDTTPEASTEEIETFGPQVATPEQLAAITPLAVDDVTLGSCTIVAAPSPENHTTCPGFDFTGQAIDGPVDLSYAELAGATFGDNSFLYEVAVARYADFSGATIEHTAIQRGTDFTGASFAGASIQSGDWWYSTFTGADFSDTVWNGMNFGGNRAEGASFARAVFTSDSAKSFRENNVSAGDFTGATFSANIDAQHNSLAGATVAGATLPPSMGGTDLLDVDLSVLASVPQGDWDLGGSRVTGASFAGLSITGLNLGGSLAVGTDFSGATFLPGSEYGSSAGYWDGSEWHQYDQNLAIDGGGTDFTDADFAGATIRGFFKLDGAELLRSDLSGLDVEGAFIDFRGSNLTSSTLDGTDFSEAFAAITDGASVSFASARGTTFPIAGGGVYEGIDFTGARLWAPTTGFAWSDHLETTLLIGNAGGSVWHDVILDGAVFLGGPNGEDLDFGGASFAKVSMAGVDLSKFRLNGAVFYQVDLTGADLRRPADFPDFGGVLFYRSDLTDAILPPAHNPVSGGWMAGFWLQESTIDATSLDIADISVTAAAGADSATVDFGLPAAFVNDDGKVPYGPDYDGSFWSGTRYECDAPAGGVFPVGSTLVTCEFSTSTATELYVCEGHEPFTDYTEAWLTCEDSLETVLATELGGVEGRLDMTATRCSDDQRLPLAPPEVSSGPDDSLVDHAIQQVNLDPSTGVIDTIDVGIGAAIVADPYPYKFTFNGPCPEGLYEAGFRAFSTASFTVTVAAAPAAGPDDEPDLDDTPVTAPSRGDQPLASTGAEPTPIAAVAIALTLAGLILAAGGAIVRRTRARGRA